MKKISRHKHRIWALKILYSLDVKDNLDREQLQSEIKHFLDGKDINIDKEKDRDLYFENIIINVITNLEEIDEEIQEKSLDWDIERLGYVDRNILRIAISEIKEGRVPRGVVIDEAVRLAKEYGGEDSSRFINGILAEIL